MSYSIILKWADNTVHRIEVPKEELADAITQIERKGSEIILIEKTAASHAEDRMTNLKELVDDGLITITPVTVSVARPRVCPKCGGTEFKENEKSWKCTFCKIRIPKRAARVEGS